MSNTISKASFKRYKCQSCGHESMIQTNHYGTCYPLCTECHWKNPMEMGQVHICLEELPEGMERPKPWTKMKLGHICKIVKGEKKCVK